MFRTFAILLTLILTTSVTAARADPPGRVARLNHAVGAVSFAPADAPQAWTPAMLNRPLTTGDRLWSDRTGRAELHVGSTAVRLAALTSLDVLHLDDDTLQLRLAQGAVNVRVRDLAAGETIEIATATGAVLLRQPGSYSISSEPQSDVSRVLVHFGQAQVVTPTQTVTVPSSQSAMISGRAGIAFEVITQAFADEFERWSAERDRREDRVTSTRYVSRDMTGYEDLDDHGTWHTLPEYGAVWVPRSVATGWAPYRHGHWSWISPWGWTWIDDAPWGFAPSHYGRWVWVNDYWAWAPGRLERRPVYAPALVAFVGGSNFSASIGSGPAVGWFPLGWREAYRPWYRASHTHVRGVNVTHVTNVTNIHNNTSVNRYVNRNRPEAVTVVPQQAFVSARPVAQASVSVSQAELTRAEIVRDRQPAEPVRASFAAERTGTRPPAHAVAREAVTITKPADPPVREMPSSNDRASFPHPRNAEPRVRVMERNPDRDETRAVERAAPQSAAQPAASLQRAQQPAPARDAAAVTTSAPATPTAGARAVPGALLSPSAAPLPSAPASPISAPPAASAITTPPPAYPAAAVQRAQQPAPAREAAAVTTSTPATPTAGARAVPGALLSPSAAPLPSTPASAISAPPTASAVTPPPARPAAAPRAPEAPLAARGTIPPAGPESDLRNARREAGPRDDSQKETSVLRDHPRAPDAVTVREAPRVPPTSNAPGEMAREREGPRPRPAPAAGAPTTGVAQALPAQPQALRREERSRESPADAPPAREGVRQRAGRDG